MKRTIYLAALLLTAMVCPAQDDAHLRTLTEGVIQLRKAGASTKALNQKVIAWSAQGMPKITLMDEIARDRQNEYKGEGANRFRMNQIVIHVYHRQNTGMTSKGDYFNSTEKDIFYSAIEKTVKARSTATYTITGHAGKQEFAVVAFSPSTDFAVSVGRKTAKSTTRGVVTVKTAKVSREDSITLTITNNSDRPESFVILNHNPQKQ